MCGATAPGHRKQTGTGFEVPKEVISLGDKMPILVVAEIVTSQVDGMQLWALNGQAEDDGGGAVFLLAIAYRVPNRYRLFSRSFLVTVNLFSPPSHLTKPFLSPYTSSHHHLFSPHP